MSSVISVLYESKYEKNKVYVLKTRFTHLKLEKDKYLHA